MLPVRVLELAPAGFGGCPAFVYFGFFSGQVVREIRHSRLPLLGLEFKVCGATPPPPLKCLRQLFLNPDLIVLRTGCIKTS